MTTTRSSDEDMAGHLARDRHMEVDRYTSVYVDDEDRVATFLVWNLSGKLIGFQTYRPDADKKQRNDPRDGRYFTYFTKPDGKNRELGVWGLETYSYRDDVLCVTEGVFDACRLHNYGIPAVAVFSNNPLHLRPWFAVLPKRLVGFRDNDDAGKKLTKFVRECRVMVEKDLGDSTEEEVLDMIGDLL